MKTGLECKVNYEGELDPKTIAAREVVVSTEEMEDEVGVITQESDVKNTQTGPTEEDSIQSMEDFMEDIEYETWVSKSSKKKQIRNSKGGFSVATRTSNRVPKDGRTVLQKATQLAKERDEFAKGNNDTNQFLVLSNLSNDAIKDVTDCLDINIEHIDDQIDIFKAEEKVRAAIAEANYREYLASVNRKFEPQGDEELQDFSLNVVDNSIRGITEVSTIKSSDVPRKRKGET